MNEMQINCIKWSSVLNHFMILAVMIWLLTHDNIKTIRQKLVRLSFFAVLRNSINHLVNASKHEVVLCFILLNIFKLFLQITSNFLHFLSCCCCFLIIPNCIFIKKIEDLDGHTCPILIKWIDLLLTLFEKT